MQSWRRGHTASIRCLALNGNLVVSGSYDNTLRVWNIETKESVHTLEVALACVQVNFLHSNIMLKSTLLHLMGTTFALGRWMQMYACGM